MIAERFRVGDLIGKGAFSKVYLGYDTLHSDKKVAIKIDSGDAMAGKRSLVEYEALVMRQLHLDNNLRGVPNLYYYGSHKSKEVIVMDCLGKDLETILRNRGGTLTILESAHLVLSLLRTVERIHDAGFLHRDLKPANCMIGLTDNMIYVADFGLAKLYVDADGKHIKEHSNKKGVTGTLRFCSVNTHELTESSRRDDLESLIYILIIMINGSLPWQGQKDKSNIAKIKRSSSLESICQNTPPQVIMMLRYVRNLDFYSRPQYDLLQSLLKEIIREQHTSA